MSRFWGWLALWTGKRAGTVAIIGLLITLILGVGTTRLRFATSQASYLNKSDKIYQDDQTYEKLFGGQAMVVMLSMKNGKNVDHLFTPKNMAQLSSLTHDLEKGAKKHQIQSVIGPLASLEYSNALSSKNWVSRSDPSKPCDISDPAVITETVEGARNTDCKVVDAEVPDSVVGKALLGAMSAPKQSAASKTVRSADTTATLKRLATEVGNSPHELTNPKWVKFLLYNNDGSIRKSLLTFFPNKTHAEVVVRLDGQQTLDEQSDSAEFVSRVAAAHHFESATTVTTGAPSLLKNINDYLKGGMFLLGGIAAAVMVVILLVLFDVRWRLLPLAVIVIGLIWAFGVAGYLGIPLTLATIAGLPVLLGVGIDYAIQMHARVEEEAVINQAEHPIQETARNLCPALLVVTLDAVFAFVALHFAKVPMIREFGYLLAVGIAVICLTSIVVPLATLGIREFKSPTKRKVSRRSEALGSAVTKLGAISGRAGGPLIVIALILFAAGIYAEPKLTLQTNPVKWVDPHSQVIQNIHALERGTGSSNELGVFAETGHNVFTQSTVNYVDTFTNRALDKQHDTIRTANSVVSIISDLINDIPHADHVTPDVGSVASAFVLAPPAVRESFATPSGRALNIIFRTGQLDGSTVPLKQQASDVDDMNAYFASTAPEGVSFTPSGLAVVGVGLLHNLESNRVLLTYLSIAFVAAYLAIRLRSVIRSLLSLVPVLIAVGLSALVEFAFDLKLSPLTTVSAPLVVAICTEFTSLILLRFVEERGRGLAPRAAMDHTAARTGRAFIVSGLTAVSGVAVIASSSMPLLRNFGIIVGSNVLVALLSALVFLPPMLIWAESGGRNWISRHLITKEALAANIAAEAAAETA